MDSLRKREAEFNAAVDEKVHEIMQDQARKRGLLGGPARAAALTPKQRSKIARKAAKARWRKVK